MARSVSDEELQLKKRARRRLIGAIVLVTAVAVVLPMVLDSEPRSSNPSISIQIPAQDAGVIAKPPAPLKPAESAAAKTAAGAEAVAPAPVAAKPEPKAEAKAPAETRPAAKAEARAAETRSPDSKPAQSRPVETQPSAKTEARVAEAKAETAKESAKSAGGYVIQVAALSDAAKAKELQAKIAAGGLKAYTEVVQTAKGPVTRVRVGPYASREAAEKARPQLQKLQLDGKVVPR
jgi:DedD protein